MGWSVYFLGAFVVSMILGFSIRILRNRLKKEWAKRLGGLAIVVSLVVVLLGSSQIELTLAIRGLLVGLLTILFFGLLDDIYRLSWKIQLLFQVLLVILLVGFFGFSVDYFIGPFEKVIRMDGFLWDLGVIKVSLISFIFVLGWFLLVINSINWIDGINGLAGGVGLLGGVALFWISLLKEVDQPAIAIIALIFIGAMLGFWWNNFPYGKIEAGTSGSYAIGFFLAATAIMAGTKVATALIVLVIPLIDFFWVIYERWRQGLPITKGDKKRHLHYKLRALGWSDAKIVFYYFAFTSLMLSGSFLMETRNWKLGVILVESLLLLLFIRAVSIKLNKQPAS